MKLFWFVHLAGQNIKTILQVPGMLLQLLELVGNAALGLVRQRVCRVGQDPHGILPGFEQRARQGHQGGLLNNRSKIILFKRLNQESGTFHSKKKSHLGPFLTHQNLVGGKKILFYPSGHFDTALH